jgi:hypothetical protein
LQKLYNNLKNFPHKEYIHINYINPYFLISIKMHVITHFPLEKM